MIFTLVPRTKKPTKPGQLRSPVTTCAKCGDYTVAKWYGWEDHDPEVEQSPWSLCDTHKRLEELRMTLRAENISYSELAELQELAEYIPLGDVELLEAAGVPEGACPLCRENEAYPDSNACRSCLDKLPF